MTSFQPTSSHLTDEQFTAELYEAGLDTVTAGHLAECKLCQEELTRVSISVASFNHMSLAWSESAPSRRLLPQSASLPLWSARLVWALAACLLLVAGLSIGRFNLQHHRVAKPGSGTSSSENSEAAITRDNHLMAEVDLAINRRDPSPTEYGLPEPDASIRTAQPESRME